jgi:hypothetical protein
VTVQIKQATCPWCGEEPGIVVSYVQAFCGKDDCVAVSWNPSMSAVENMADIGVVDLQNFLGKGD